MKKENVSQAIKFATENIKSLEKTKSNLAWEIKEIDKQISKTHSEITRIRNLCPKHTYIGKPDGVMGRGICEICGDSDY